LQREATKTGE